MQSNSVSGYDRRAVKEFLTTTCLCCIAKGIHFLLCTVTAVLSCFITFSSNGVLCCANCLDVFKHAKITKRHHCNADDVKTLKAKYMIIRLLYAYRMTKGAMLTGQTRLRFGSVRFILVHVVACAVKITTFHFSSIWRLLI